jgi:hypothetical protein
MATILDRNSYRWNEIQRIQMNLRDTLMRVETFNGLAESASPTELETVYGIPAAGAEAAKTLMGNVEAALKTAGVQNLLNNIA